MGEQSGKPKMEGQWRPYNNNRQHRGYQPPATTKLTPFSAPTAGYEKKVFTYGQPDSATVFEDVRKSLSRYVASYRKGGQMAQEAIDDSRRQCSTSHHHWDPTQTNGTS